VTDISVVIPFYNEEENLRDLVKQLNEYAIKQNFTINAILVDDGSSDSSVQVLREIESNIPLKLVRLSRNYGSHAAIRAGITQANGRYTMFFSADMQEPFSVIGEMYYKACEGYDIVLARRTEKQVSFYERFFSFLYTSLIRKFAVSEYPKGGANNFLFCSKVRDHLCENIESNSSIGMQLLSIGFRKTVIDVSIGKRSKGKSKWTFSKKVKTFFDSFVAFSYFPIRMITVLGIILFTFGFLYALWIIIGVSTGLIIYDTGFPTIVSVLMIGFGLTNFSLGIVAEYIWRILDVARGRPVFIIDTIDILTEMEK